MCFFFFSGSRKLRTQLIVQAVNCSIESTDVYWILVFTFKLPLLFSFSSSHVHSKNKLLRSSLVHTRLWTICITEMFYKDSWNININGQGTLINISREQKKGKDRKCVVSSIVELENWDVKARSMLLFITISSTIKIESYTCMQITEIHIRHHLKKLLLFVV